MNINDIWNNINNFIDGINSYQWISLAFVLFIILIGKKVFCQISAGLGKNIEEIRSKINKSSILKKEAENILLKAEKDLEEAKIRAEEIIQNAKNEAQKLNSEYEKELERAIEGKNQKFESRVKMMQNDANKEVTDLIKKISKETFSEISQEISEDNQVEFINKQLVNLTS